MCERFSIPAQALGCYMYWSQSPKPPVLTTTVDNNTKYPVQMPHSQANPKHRPRHTCQDSVPPVQFRHRRLPQHDQPHRAADSLPTQSPYCAPLPSRASPLPRRPRRVHRRSAQRRSSHRRHRTSWCTPPLQEQKRDNTAIRDLHTGTVRRAPNRDKTAICRTLIVPQSP